MASPPGENKKAIIFGVRHYDVLEDRDELAADRAALLKALGGLEGRRRVFFEGTGGDVEVIVKVNGMPLGRIDPHVGGLNYALARGWEVIPLDKETHRNLALSGRMNTDDPAFEAVKLNRNAHYTVMKNYLTKNVRERSWALKAKRERMGSGDIAIMHQMHVKGFLKETGLDADVVWISRITENDYPEVFERLSTEEVEALHAQRNHVRRRPLAKN